MAVDTQAEALNQDIRDANASVFEMLSERGKAIFFPKNGILAQAKDAKGKAINATIGVALEGGGPMALNCVTRRVKLPEEFVLYAGSYGRQELREKWGEMMREKNPSLKKTSLPVVTSALTHALSVVGYLFVDGGDELVLPDLFWGNYKLIFNKAWGAEMKTFKTFEGGGFNVKKLGQALAGGKKKILLLNFPNNPTGYTPTEEEGERIVEAIREAAKQTKIVVIVDDAYFGLNYGGGMSESIFTKLCDIENVLAIKVDGPTKEDYVWGLRVGFITYGFRGLTEKAACALEDKTAGAIRGNISNASNLSQMLLLEAYSDADYAAQKKEKFEVLRGRYKKVRRVLEKNYRHFEALPFNSGYFMCVKLRRTNGEKLRKLLLEAYDTGVIVMGDVVRVAFSSIEENKIETLFENIEAACEELS